MLDNRQDRRPIAGRVRASVAVALLALAVPVAIAAQGTPSDVTGTVTDETNKPVAGVAVTLSDTSRNVRIEATSDATGHFAFANVSPGQYELRAARPGFKLVVERVAVDGRTVTRDLRLELGEVHETVTTLKAATPESRAPRPAVTPPPAPSNCSETSGGAVVPPMKLKDVKPIYPPGVDVEGVVTLAATIGKDGKVRDVKTVSSPNPEFARAATDAVEQWEFSTTYLNCAPVDLRMQVTVNFTPERK